MRTKRYKTSLHRITVTAMAVAALGISGLAVSGAERNVKTGVRIMANTSFDSSSS
jgi:hypothetical protein